MSVLFYNLFSSRKDYSGVTKELYQNCWLKKRRLIICSRKTLAVTGITSTGELLK
jgi:hypothetical protein